MKQTVKTSRAAGQLEKMFRELNKHYFAGKLPEPIISLKKTPSAYGHITCSKVWQAGGENKYEINISSATLDRPIEETASTLLHEMVHEYCIIVFSSFPPAGYQASFPALRGFDFPLLPLSDVRSGNHAIHSAPPPVLPLAKLRRFSLIGDTKSLLVFPHSTQHRQHRHTGEVDFCRLFVIFMQLRHTLASLPGQRTRR